MFEGEFSLVKEDGCVILYNGWTVLALFLGLKITVYSCIGDL